MAEVVINSGELRSFIRGERPHLPEKCSFTRLTREGGRDLMDLRKLRRDEDLLHAVTIDIVKKAAAAPCKRPGDSAAYVERAVEQIFLLKNVSVLAPEKAAELRARAWNFHKTQAA